MEASYILISTISPEKGKKLDAFDKHSKYVVKVLTPTDFSKTLFEYAVTIQNPIGAKNFMVKTEKLNLMFRHCFVPKSG